MIALKMKLETATYDGHNEDALPHLSGYGNQVEVEITGGENCVVLVGGHRFLPAQLEELVQEIKAYKAAVRAYERLRS